MVSNTLGFRSNCMAQLSTYLQGQKQMSKAWQERRVMTGGDVVSLNVSHCAEGILVDAHVKHILDKKRTPGRRA